MAQTIIMMAALFLVMYLFMIRPENNRKKKEQEMRESLKKGDVITSIGGIVGRIVHINANSIIIETSEDRVRMELLKTAVARVGGADDAEDTSSRKAKKEEPKKEEPKELKEKVDEIPAPEKEDK